MVVYFHTGELTLYTPGLQKHHPGSKNNFSDCQKYRHCQKNQEISLVCPHTAWHLMWQPAFRPVCSLVGQLPLTWSTKLRLRTTLIFFKPFVQIERLGLQAKVHCSLQHGTVIQSLCHWCYWPVWDWRPGAATMGFSGAATTLGTEVFICNRRTKLRVLAGEPLTVMNTKTLLFIGKTYFRMWTTPVASHPPWRSDSGLFLLKCIYAQQTSIFYHSLH